MPLKNKMCSTPALILKRNEFCCKIAREASEGDQFWPGLFGLGGWAVGVWVGEGRRRGWGGHWDQLPDDTVGTCLPHLDTDGKARLSEYMGQRKGGRDGGVGKLRTGRVLSVEDYIYFFCPDGRTRS